MNEYAFQVIDVMKDLLAHQDVSEQSVAKLQKKLAIEIDRRVVNNRSTDEIQRLYDDVLWLRSTLAL